MKTISFLLPAYSHVPSGGFKVVFEYANRLDSVGYRVRIYFGVFLDFRGKKLKTKIGSIYRLLHLGLWKKYYPYHWFPLKKSIECHLVSTLSQKNVSSSDVYIATAADTAEYLGSFILNSKQRAFYFVQGFETWDMSRERLFESYKLPLKKIAVSNWIKEVIESVGEEAIYIPNGFDFDHFNLVTEIEKRDDFRIVMLNHLSPLKRVVDGIEALKLVKNKFPLLKVNMFGTTKRPANLPDWFDYFQRPQKDVHNRIYNEASIFLATSESEGWGLTVGEAMICGCAVVCTDNPGHRVMASDYETALLCPTRSPEQMAAKVIRLLGDKELRYRIARRGNEFIRKFTWDASVSSLVKQIEATDK